MSSFSAQYLIRKEPGQENPGFPERSFLLQGAFDKRFQVYSFEDIYPGTGEISDEGKEGNVFEIPAEIEFFQSHSYDTGSGADDEDTSAYSGTIGKEFPETADLYEIGHISCRSRVGNRVHAHSSRHERNVVDDR